MPTDPSALRRIPEEWFDLYLRTGAAPWNTAGVVELKYNHWLDPKTGQFTSAGDGTWMGGGFTGGGGGSFDGGGSSASWDLPAPKKVGGPAPRKQTSAAPAAQAVLSGSAHKQPQDRVVVRNGYSYTLDRIGRTVSVTGTLSLASDPQRSRSAQAAAGGNDRLRTDDGGHYIAARFNGPTDTFNHFAQDANFNRGGYRVLENGWANDIKAGKQVYVAITSSYAGSSRRPSTINVVYSVNGQRGSQQFPNSSKGKTHGK